MLSLIGLGLGEDEITLRGLDRLKESDKVYIERYTNRYDGLDSLKERSGVEIVEIERPDMEENQNKILEEAKEKNVSILIPGDPLAATTHSDLFIECKKKNIECEIVHSSSIFIAIADTGLQLYKFGRTVTVPYPEEGYKPTSYLDYIKQNQEQGLHTLCLLDVKPPRFMSVKEALEFLDFPEVIGAHFGKNTVIKYGKREDVMKEDIPTPSVVIVPGKLHEMEKEMLDLYKVN